MNKISGWKRVSLVITTIYVVIAAIYSYSSYSKAMTFNLKLTPEVKGFAVYVKPSESELEQIMVSRKAAYPKCIKEIDQNLDAEKKEEKKRFCGILRDMPLNSCLKKPNYVAFSLVLIMYPTIFWCSWLAIVSVIKWVIAGFKQSE